MAEPSILGRATFAQPPMAEPSKTHAPFGLRRNLDRGTAPRARARPGRGAVWPSLRCRHRRHTSVRVIVAAARRCAPTSPAPPRLAYVPPALATRPFVLSPRTAGAGAQLACGSLIVDNPANIPRHQRPRAGPGMRGAR